MRTRTFVLSFVVHATVICTVMVARTFATTELPEPPQPTRFMIARTEMPDVPAPPARGTPAASPSAVNHDATPVVEPDSVAPEVPGFSDAVPIGAEVSFGSPGDVGGAEIGPAPSVAPARVTTPPPPLRVGGVVRPPQKVHHVAPAYPALAQAARVSGTVILEALIGEDGSVRDVKVLSSKPLLDDAAVAAVRQWRFTPTLLNGVPVQVLMTVTVAFTLS